MSGLLDRIQKRAYNLATLIKLASLNIKTATKSPNVAKELFLRLSKHPEFAALFQNVDKLKGFNFARRKAIRQELYNLMKQELPRNQEGKVIAEQALSDAFFKNKLQKVPENIKQEIKEISKEIDNLRSQTALTGGGNPQPPSPGVSANTASSSPAGTGAGPAGAGTGAGPAGAGTGAGRFARLKGRMGKMRDWYGRQHGAIRYGVPAAAGFTAFPITSSTLSAIFGPGQLSRLQSGLESGMSEGDWSNLVRVVSKYSENNPYLLRDILVALKHPDFARYVQTEPGAEALLGLLKRLSSGGVPDYRGPVSLVSELIPKRAGFGHANVNSMDRLVESVAAFDSLLDLLVNK